MNENYYVQYGCGWSAAEGWRNYDASPTLRFERLPAVGKLYTKNATRFPENVEYGDIVSGLPVSEATCRGVYCSHILEHLSLNDFRAALIQTKKMLRQDGIFRLVLPDLEYMVKEYLNNTSDDAAVDFIKQTGLGQANRERGIKGILLACFGNSQHLWMWDYKSIRAELQSAGFDRVRRAYFGDSSDPMFKKVEDRERWENCLGVECRVPD